MRFAIATLAVTLVPVASMAIAQELGFIEAEFDGVDGVDGLQLVAGLVVVPGGKIILTAGAGDFSVGVFARDAASGEVTFLHRFHDVDGDALNNVRGLAASPEGTNFYSAALGEDKVGAFTVDPTTGDVTFIEAFEDGVGGVTGLAGPMDVAVSPDGANVYVASVTSDSVAVFARAEGSGALTFLEAQVDGVGGVDGLDAALGLSVSPDGAHLYVAAALDDAITVFSRDGEGRLTLVEVERDGIDGVDGLDEANGVAISPDGRHVVVVSDVGPVGGDDWLAVFSRQPATGELDFVAAVPNPVPGEFGGCTGGPTDPADRVVFAPDGSRVWAANPAHQAVAALRLASDGTPELLGMTCNGVDGVGGLQSVSGVAASEDGRHVYATGLFDNSLVALRVLSLIFTDGFESGDTEAWAPGD